MADAPERIWAWGYPSTDRDNLPCDERGWEEDACSEKWFAEHNIALTEYIRADLAPTDAQVMAHPKVKALVGALVSVRADAQIMLAVGKIERTVNAALRELDGING